MRKVFLSATVVLAFGAGAIAVARGEQSRPDRSGDEIWLVSSRGVSCLSRCARDDIGGGLRYWRYDQNVCKWCKSDRTEFLTSSDPALPTCVWVHGDREEAEEAFETGRTVYQQLTACAAPDQPMRFVIWSWPSQKELVGHPFQDGRIKAGRTGAAGLQLGWFLSQLDPQAPVSLIGYSFGARVVTGALHVLGGGALSEHALPAGQLGPGGYHVILMAAALNRDWLFPGRPHELAPAQMERLLLLYNNCDWVLKRYPRIICGPDALGYVGLSGRRIVTLGPPVEQINAAAYIGKQHSWQPYFSTRPLIDKIRHYALFPAVAAADPL